MVSGLAGCRYFRLVPLFLSYDLHHVLIAALFGVGDQAAYRIHLVIVFDRPTAVRVFFLALINGGCCHVQSAHSRSLPLALVVGGGPHRLRGFRWGLGTPLLVALYEDRLTSLNDCFSLQTILNYFSNLGRLLLLAPIYVVTVTHSIMTFRR